MKNYTPFLIGLFLTLVLAGCKYDPIPLPCPDDTNPECPCPNPSNPECPCPNPSNPECEDPCDNPNNPNCCDDPDNPNCCDDLPFPDCGGSSSFTTFDTLLIGNSMLDCNTPTIEEVVELPNGEGYVIVGFCADLSQPNMANRRALVIHIDTLGNVLCKPQYSLFGDDFLKSVDYKDGKLIATGHTRNSGGGSFSDVYNLTLISNSTGYCDGEEAYFFDPSSNNMIEKWDQGNSIEITTDNSVVVGGKGSIYPSLFKLNDINNLNSVQNYANFELDDFDGVAPNMIAVTGDNTCDVDHHVNKIIQTGDGGFLFTGLINTEEAGKTYSKAYLAKTASNSINITPAAGWIEIFDNNELLGKNTVGRDIAQVNGGFNFIIAGYGYDEDVPEDLLACGSTAFSDYDFNGFIVMLDVYQGSVQGKQFFDVQNNSRDYINGISTLYNENNESGSDSDLVAVGSVWRNNTEKLQVKHYNTENSELNPGNISFNIESDSDKKTIGKDIIPTSDGGFLIIANVKSSIGVAESIRIIKTDPSGNF